MFSPMILVLSNMSDPGPKPAHILVYATVNTNDFNYSSESFIRTKIKMK